MKLLFLLLALLGAIVCQRRLSYNENQQLKRICGVASEPLRHMVSDEGLGRRSIYGGRNIDGKKAPWTVFLNFGDNKCTGALISSRHILTATHCLEMNSRDRNPILKNSTQECENDDKVYTQNSRELKIFTSNLKPLSFDIARIAMINMCIYDDYAVDDFAVLEIREDIQFNEYVQPICVPSNMALEKIGVWLQITGFGNRHRKMGDKTKFPPVLRHAWMQLTKFNGNGRMIVVRNDEEEELGVREGDSGGPAYAESNNKEYVIGLSSTSWPDNSAWYASVGYHLPDICYNTGVC